LDKVEALLSNPSIKLEDFTLPEITMLHYSLRSVVARSMGKKEESFLLMEKAWTIIADVTDQLLLSIFFYNSLGVLLQEGFNPKNSKALNCFHYGWECSRNEKKTNVFGLSFAHVTEAE